MSWNLFKLNKILGSSRIHNFDFYLSGDARGKALLSYVSSPIKLAIDGSKPLHFGNDGIVISWVQVLNQLGYTVDVINWDDTGDIGVDVYDLVVGHGGKNTEQLLRAKKPNGKLIYWSSGSYWKYHNDQGVGRTDDFYKRHNVQIAPDRQIDSPEEEICKAADTIITLGTDTVRRTYSKFEKVYNIEVATFPDGHHDTMIKDFKESRSNFLFFSGGGNLHKGLDIVIEAFSLLKEQNLYICTSLSDMFREFYATKLERHNISYEGIVELRTSKFYDLVDKCGYVISASCAEGGPSSVADCMIQGLVPLATPEAAVWTNCGFEIKDTTPAMLADQITALSQIPPSELKSLSNCTYEHARTQQSPKQFQEKLFTLVSNIISETK